MPERTICAIHQPNFFPRLSTLAKLYAADVWVVLDDVQYNGRDYQNRCRLALLDNPAKWQWLSLPVHRPHGRASRIDEVYIAEASTLMLLRMLGWCGQVQRSSELPSRCGRSERLADLVHAVGTDTYLCGTGGRRYLDRTQFDDHGLGVRWFEAPATDAEPVGMWSEARQVSAVWALMWLGAEAVQAELNNVRRTYR